MSGDSNIKENWNISRKTPANTPALGHYHTWPLFLTPGARLRELGLVATEAAAGVATKYIGREVVFILPSFHLNNSSRHTYLSYLTQLL